MQINNKGHLEIGGVDVVNLAKDNEYPIYVIDEELLRNNIQAYKNSLKQNYKETSAVFYSANGGINLALCKIIEQEGIGLAITTEGQLYTALQANFPAANIIMHGNNKSSRELERALEANVGYIVMDNMEEILLLEQMARKLKKIPNVLIRIKPQIAVSANSHYSIHKNESKFGFYISQPETLKSIELLHQSPAINFLGLHTNIGPQNLELNKYEQVIINNSLIK